MKEGKLFIQFGSLPKKMEVNTIFTLLKTFEAKKGQQVPNDEESKASKEDDPEVKYPKFMINEYDCIYSFEEPSFK